MLPQLLVTEAVGIDESSEPKIFNDLQSVGGWPSQENIDKIMHITFWADQYGIHGLKITYRLINKRECEVCHGNEVGDVFNVPPDRNLYDTEFFVGMNGIMDRYIGEELVELQPAFRKNVSVEGTKGKIRSLGFLVYNQLDGSITPYGPFPVPNKSKSESQSLTQFQGFAALGLLKGFTGTLHDNNDLATLAVYKVLSGELGWYGVSDTSNFDSFVLPSK